MDVQSPFTNLQHWPSNIAIIILTYSKQCGWLTHTALRANYQTLDSTTGRFLAALYEIIACLMRTQFFNDYGTTNQKVLQNHSSKDVLIYCRSACLWNDPCSIVQELFQSLGGKWNKNTKLVQMSLLSFCSNFLHLSVPAMGHVTAAHVAYLPQHMTNCGRLR